MSWFDTLLGRVPDTAQKRYSIGDPAFAAWLEDQGISVFDGTDQRALALSAVYRCVSIIAGTIAGLPLKTYRDGINGVRREISSFLTDNPAGPYDISPFSWKELVIGHIAMRGEAFLIHVLNRGGAIIGLLPVHPNAVTDVRWVGADKVFTVQLDNGQSRKFDSNELTQVMGLTLDGLRGVSPLHAYRQGIATALAADNLANGSFVNGLGIRGIVTPELDVTEEDAAIIKAGLDAKAADNPGGWAVVNRKLHFSPLAMTNEDAQLIQQRNFQVEDIFRMWGLPISLASMSGAVSNWGTGVQESFLGLQKFTLGAYTSRLEEALSPLLPDPQFVEFDYHGLLQGTPTQEIELLIKQVDAGLLSADEARAVLNLPPLPPSSFTVSTNGPQTTVSRA